jgi:hypothetical protein
MIGCIEKKDILPHLQEGFNEKNRSTFPEDKRFHQIFGELIDGKNVGSTIRLGKYPDGRIMTINGGNRLLSDVLPGNTRFTLEVYHFPDNGIKHLQKCCRLDSAGRPQNKKFISSLTESKFTFVNKILNNLRGMGININKEKDQYLNKIYNYDTICRWFIVSKHPTYRRMEDENTILNNATPEERDKFVSHLRLLMEIVSNIQGKSDQRHFLRTIAIMGWCSVMNESRRNRTDTLNWLFRDDNGRKGIDRVIMCIRQNNCMSGYCGQKVFSLWKFIFATMIDASAHCLVEAAKNLEGMHTAILSEQHV